MRLALDGPVRQRVERALRKASAICLIVLGLALALHKAFPSLFETFGASLLGFDERYAVLLSMFWLILHFVWGIDVHMREEAAAAKMVWRDSSREDSYLRICQLLETRGTTAKRIECLQFSGVTAIPILKQVAKRCPDATISVLVVKPEYADRFDDAPFHSRRVEHFIGEATVLRESCPNLKLEIWQYDTEPSVASIVIDDWLVSVGWYKVFKRPDGKKSIRGHVEPAETAIDSAAEPLLRMARHQFERVKAGVTDPPVLRFPPPNPGMQPTR